MTDEERGLLVSELFGPTVQGEGPQTGRLAHFIRLGLCNLDCSWCDTPYTWDWTGKNGLAYDRGEQLRRMGVGSILDWIDERAGDGIVVLSGGEPMVQRRGLEELIRRAPSMRRWSFSVETNGTIEPTPTLMAGIDQWVVSPKLANSGVGREKAWNVDVLRSFNVLNVAFKFVVRSAACLDEIDELRSLTGIPARQVWIMPEGTDEDTIRGHAALVADASIAAGYNLTGRMHVSLWGNVRGR